MILKRKLKKKSVLVKKNKVVTNYTEKSNGIRISYHEKVCAERMKTLFKAIEEMRMDIKNLHSDMNKGKGVISFLVILGVMGKGPIDMVVLDIDTGEYQAYDVKSANYRKSDYTPKDTYKRLAGSLINRSLTVEQKKLKVKIYYNK